MNSSDSIPFPHTATRELLGAYCPVLLIASILRDHRLEMVRNDVLAVDAERQGKKRLADQYTAAETNSCDGDISARRLIASVKARSIAGVAIQIVEAIETAEAIADEVRPGSGIDHHRIDRHYRALIRLLFSALDCLEQRAKVDVEDAVSPRYAARHLNPWLTVDERSSITHPLGEAWR